MVVFFFKLYATQLAVSKLWRKHCTYMCLVFEVEFLLLSFFQPSYCRYCHKPWAGSFVEEAVWITLEDLALFLWCYDFSPAGPLDPEHVVEIQTESQAGSQLPVRAINFTADDSILMAYSGDAFLQPAFEKLVRLIFGLYFATCQIGVYCILKTLFKVGSAAFTGWSKKLAVFFLCTP